MKKFLALIIYTHGVFFTNTMEIPECVGEGCKTISALLGKTNPIVINMLQPNSSFASRATYNLITTVGSALITPALGVGALAGIVFYAKKRGGWLSKVEERTEAKKVRKQHLDKLNALANSTQQEVAQLQENFVQNNIDPLYHNATLIKANIVTANNSLSKAQNKVENCKVQVGQLETTQQTNYATILSYLKTTQEEGTRIAEEQQIDDPYIQQLYQETEKLMKDGRKTYVYNAQLLLALKQMSNALEYKKREFKQEQASKKLINSASNTNAITRY